MNRPVLHSQIKWALAEAATEPTTLRAEEVDGFLGFPQGTFDHIPHYAREEALAALRQVRDLEIRSVFRPGLYYVVLSDLCRATEAASQLGNELAKKRIETFILTGLEALGRINAKNYHLFLREIGDAVLILFASMHDAYDWWQTMNSWLAGRNDLWISEKSLSDRQARHFRLAAKTIIHAGEVSYSGINVPLAAAINQVFKVEKCFKADELGITDVALSCSEPVLKSLRPGLRPKLRTRVTLPGNRIPTATYLLDTCPEPRRAKRQTATRSRRR